MNTIEILYLTASAVSVIAMAPQVRQLYISKQSDELSLSTWGIWFMTQIMSFVYAVNIRAIPLIIANIAWLVFYIVMVTMIIRYRRQATPQLVYGVIEPDDLSR